MQIPAPRSARLRHPGEFLFWNGGLWELKIEQGINMTCRWFTCKSPAIPLGFLFFLVLPQNHQKLNFSQGSEDTPCQLRVFCFLAWKVRFWVRSCSEQAKKKLLSNLTSHLLVRVLANHHSDSYCGNHDHRPFKEH